MKEEETERGDIDDADGEASSLIPLVYTVSGLFSASAVSYAVLPRQLVLAAQFGVTSVSQVGTYEGGFGWYQLDECPWSRRLRWFHSDVCGCVPTYL